MSPVANLRLVLQLTVVMMTGSSEPSNVLAVLPVASKSHHFMFRSIIKELGNRGHNLTVITPFDMYANLTNINQIILHTSAEKFIDAISYDKILSLGNTPLIWPAEMSFWFYGMMMCEEYLQSDILQSLIHSDDDKFDLLLLETSFGQESLIGLSKRFNAPVVSLNSAVNFVFLDEFIGNPLSLAFVPHVESQIASPMSFFERLWNAARSSVVLMYGYYFYLPKHETLMKKYLNYTAPENIPPIIDMLKNNISLAVSNAHISIENARPLVPNVIGAAGLHINKNPPKLPQDLQEYMDKSTNGVIYFSFGTIIPAHLLPDEQKQTLLNAFGKIRQNILWKANMDSMENLPKNVKISKWFPQQSILAHNNCKAFVTHGGIFSVQEAVYFGVPLVGVPHFSDQHMNIARAEKVGYAINLNRKNITTESIVWALNEVINNNRYREKAKKYSEIFRDNPIDQLDNAVFWIEYVMRYRGAKHLRTSKLDLPIYQYLLLDVILFIILVLALLLIFILVILKTIIYQINKYTNYISMKNKKCN